MSRAYQCDRCRKLYKGPLPVDDSGKHKRITDARGGMHDLCPECNAELDAWFAAGQNAAEEEKS